jgi:hypothetical protein
MNTLSRLWWFPLFLVLMLAGAAAHADDEEVWAPTPPRLGYLEGDVSYWREGADDWARARVNLALAAGDALYSERDANFEVQFGPRSFVRGDEATQLTLVELDAQRIQFKLTDGRVSFDLRSMAAGETVEVSTPDAVFVITHPGYYRVDVSRQETRFVTRRGGEAELVTADGRSLSVYPSEEVVVLAGNPVRVATYAAPPPDAWDRWNDARSDRLSDSISARYLPPGVYGVDELDRYGHWRVVPSYGAVWIPYGVGVNWVPYSSGSWVWDPYYEWTWIDDAPWGWAPFHYGRWVYIDGFWAWAPGPVVRRPVYAPALVAFFIRDHDVSVRFSFGLPGVWWVALGWGEPVVPWWHRHRHHGHPRWDGWGGPRVVNNVVVRQTTVIKVNDIHYHHAQRPGAVLTVPADKFGRERVRATVESRYRHGDFAPVRGALPLQPTRASLVGGAPRAVAPPREVVERRVVSTRPPRIEPPAWQDEAARRRVREQEAVRYVVPPARRGEAVRPSSRPPFGAEAGPERAPLPPPPRYGDVKREAVPAPGRSQPVGREPVETRPPAPVRTPPAGPAPRPPAPPMQPVQPVQPVQPRPAVEPQRAPTPPAAVRERPLPGQPASQTYRGHERSRDDPPGRERTREDKPQRDQRDDRAR